MPPSPSISESQDRRNTERLKALIRLELEAELNRCVVQYADWTAAAARIDDPCVTSQPAIWDERIRVIQWLLRRYSPKTSAAYRPRTD